MAGYCTSAPFAREKIKTPITFFFFSLTFFSPSLKKTELFFYFFSCFFFFCTNLSPHMLVRFQIKCVPQPQSFYTVSKSNVNVFNTISKFVLIAKDSSSPHTQKKQFHQVGHNEENKNGLPFVSLIENGQECYFFGQYIKL